MMVELIKCIDQFHHDPIMVELIKCIDPYEGEANLGVWRPLPPCSTAAGGGGREGGRREDIGL